MIGKVTGMSQGVLGFQRSEEKNAGNECGHADR